MKLRPVMIGTALGGLACGLVGPRPEFPESSTCGSTLEPGDLAPLALQLVASGPLGRQCRVVDGTARCAYAVKLPDGAVAHVTRDSSATCAVYANGRLWCDVGVYDYGNEPPFDDPGPWSRVEVSARGACAIRADGSLWCRGTAPPPTVGSYVDVALGYDHVCALATDGAVSCWGSMQWCQSDAPPGRYVDLTAAEQTTCGARADGGIDCWGSTQTARPVHAGKAVEVALADGDVLCARYDDGAIACSDPTWRMPKGKFTALAPGGFLTKNACALREDGETVCFGPAAVLPEGATAELIPVEPASYNAPSWHPVTHGPFEVKLPCEAALQATPVEGLQRATCMRSDPAELIALELIEPPLQLVENGPDAMLAFAVDSKLQGFPGATLARANSVRLNGHLGVAYDIDVPPSARILGRAYVDDAVLYAITGMYDTSSTQTSSYGRVADAVASARFTDE